jgi:UDP-2-acetamido-3-amino-2,3-dideoxy-glucuronate N-acetyltransferase
MLQEGGLGKLQYIHSNRLNLVKIRREENILWSFAPHDISVILSLVGEEPSGVTVTATNILHPKIADSAITIMRFPPKLRHVFLFPGYILLKNKLVIIGDRKMVVFDDTAPVEQKLVIYPHQIFWKSGTPVPEKKMVPLSI